MKKRIIAWAVLLSVCAAALGLWCSAAAGKAARTLPCEEEGLILSITTFDGKSESKSPSSSVSGIHGSGWTTAPGTRST